MLHDDDLGDGFECDQSLACTQAAIASQQPKARLNDGLGRVVQTDGTHSDALQCRWRSWRVVGPRALALDIPPDNCADMGGAIRVAEALMPGVREIHTFCDGAADAMYSCVGGPWQAFTV